MTAWALMVRCGLSVDADRFQAAHEFIAKGTNKIGYVWYADGRASYCLPLAALLHYNSDGLE
jgi:hypothetical protein